MTKDKLSKLKLPDTPGVYFFLGAKKNILYIGKATSLKSRVRSYFTHDIHEKRSELIAQMVQEAVTVETTVTDSVLEALILETNLIRTHKPKYNSRSKDDKSYNHLIITNEEWPRVLVVRGKDLTEKYNAKDIKYHFGPFPSGALFREALKIVRRLFKFYDTKQPVGSASSKLARGQIDFNRQIGLYPNADARAEYTRTIRHLKLFFEGKKHKIIAELEKEMMRAAKAERFEEAGTYKKRIFALNHIQDIALLKAEHKVYRDNRTLRIEAYDIAHMAGQNMVGVMTVLEGGEVMKSEYRKFIINSVDQANDPAALREVLERRLQHPEWPFPQIIVVDGNTVQKRVAELVLQQHALMIPVVAVVKDERHKADRILGAKDLITNHKLEILHANAESHRFAIGFYRTKQRKNALT